MKTGDTKQAVMLGVVAILAVGFLLYRVLPKQNKFFPLLGGPRTATTSEGNSAAPALPLALVGNPFSHPKLGSPVEPIAVPPPKADIDKTGGFLPVKVDGLPNATAAGGNSGDSGAGNPEESAGSFRQQEQEPHIALKAVLRVDEPIALLAVENEKAQMYKVGDELAAGIRLLSIGRTDVTLSVSGKKRRLQVGDSLGNSEKQ